MSDTKRQRPPLGREIVSSIKGDNTFDHWSHPVGFWVWIGVVLVIDVLLVKLALSITDPGVVRFMAAGALLLVTAMLLAPTCLDLTGYTMAVYMMLPAGLALLVGSPLVYALWVAFVGPHVEVTIK